MPKHLYFNPKNFDELVLSGVLIEFFITDLEVHLHENGQTLRFVQGENIVENNIDNILSFANRISGHKIFGRNWQQQAVISMIKGVCKDIEKKLSVAIESSQISDKIEYLNAFWFNKSNEWIKKRFYSCHMDLLTLSFAIQEKFPEILTKHQCFVELRRLFIEQKLLSKTSLIAMFTHPDNKYQEYDLFPELESSIHDVRRSMGSTYGEDTGEFIKDNNLDSYVQVTAHVMDDDEEMKGETATQMVTEQLSQMMTVNTNQLQHQHNQEQHIDHQPSHAHHVNAVEQQSHVTNNTVENETDQQTIKTHPENIVISQIREQQQQAIVTNMTSDISTIKQETHVSEQIAVTKQQQQTLNQDFTHEHEHQQHEENHHHHEQEKSQHHHQHLNIEQSSSNMKKSLKDEFSQHLIKPLQYVTKNQVDQNKDVQQKHDDQVNKNLSQPQPQQAHSQDLPIHQNHQQKANASRSKTANATFELKKQALIQEAQSQNYVSQQNLHHENEKEKAIVEKEEEKQQNKQPEQKIQSKNIQPLQQQNKAPESQSHNASVKGPTSAMNNERIKPKQQSVAVHKQTCKCEIF